jgi:hypothetical protein
MALLTVTDVGESLAWANCDATSAGYDAFHNDGKCNILVHNGSASTRTVTVVAQDAMGCPAGELHDATVTIPAGDYGNLAPAQLEAARFNNRQTGQSRIEYDDETDMVIAIFRVIQ